MPSETIKCVVCSQPMKKTQVPAGVEIDYCDAHGIWLDLNELQTILQHAQEGAKAAQPSVLEGLGQTLVQTAVSGAGWGAGSSIGNSVASALIHKIFG